MEESGVEYKGTGWSSKILNHSCHFFSTLKNNNYEILYIFNIFLIRFIL